jgi:hypothetical protein
VHRLAWVCTWTGGHANRDHEDYRCHLDILAAPIGWTSLKAARSSGLPRPVGWRILQGAHLAPILPFRLNISMRGGGVIILVGLTALIAYSLGRQDAPTGKPSPTVIITPPSGFEKPIALVSPPVEAPQAPAPIAASSKQSQPDKPSQSDIKRKGELALTAAAIAAIIVQASRDQYHATGKPCACPDDLTRNGQRCGGRSAYSRPGGAAPLCYPGDVTQAMIEEYRRTAGAGTRAMR